jgi:hypothetical protein
MNPVEITVEDMLALLKIEAAEAMKQYKKGEKGECLDNLERAQELILAIQNEA